jgi:hypothetical protein
MRLNKGKHTHTQKRRFPFCLLVSVFSSQQRVLPCCDFVCRTNLFFFFVFVLYLRIICVYLLVVFSIPYNKLRKTWFSFVIRTVAVLFVSFPFRICLRICT